jgi:hypothetical protein
MSPLILCTQEKSNSLGLNSVGNGVNYLKQQLISKDLILSEPIGSTGNSTLLIHCIYPKGL